MTKIEGGTDMLDRLFDALKDKRTGSATVLIDKANGKEAQDVNELRLVFRKKALSCYKNLIKSIIPLENSYSEEDADFNIYFKTKGRLETGIKDWERGFDGTVKVLSSRQSLSEFYRTQTFLNSRGLILVIQMTKNISDQEFKGKFDAELSRVGKLVHNPQS